MLHLTGAVLRCFARLAISKIEGDRLTIFMGKERPKSFKETPPARLIFKRKPK